MECADDNNTIAAKALAEFMADITNPITIGDGSWRRHYAARNYFYSLICCGGAELIGLNLPATGGIAAKCSGAE